MASKTYTGYYSNGLGRIRLILEINTVDTNIANNTTTERSRLYAYVDNASSGWYNLYGSPVSATIDNATRNANVTWDYRTTGQKILLDTWDTQVTHDPNGKKTISVSAFHDSGTGLGTASINDLYVCDTVPRASTISATSGYIGDTITIIADKKSESFTHTVTWGFGTLSGTIATKTSASTFTFTIPESFYEIIPNNKYGIGAFYCTTYDGDTQIGETQSARFSVYTNEEACKPDVSINVVEANTTLETGYTTQQLTGSNKKIISGYSNAIVTSTFGSKKSSTLADYTIRCNDGNLKISGNLSGETSKTLTTNFENVSGSYFSSTIMDSRGYSNMAIERLTLVEYDNIKTSTFKLQRETQVSSNVVLNLQGTFWNDNFGSVNNEITAQYRYKFAGDDDTQYSEYAPIELQLDNSNFSFNGILKKASGENEEFSYQQAYTIQILLLDKVKPYVLTDTIIKGIAVFDYGENDFKVNYDFEVVGKAIIDGGEIVSNKYLFVADFSKYNIPASEATPIDLSFASVDDINCLDSESNSYIVPISGWYRIICDCRVNDIGGNGAVGIGLRGYRDNTLQEIYNSTNLYWNSQYKRLSPQFTTIWHFEEGNCYKPVIYVDGITTDVTNGRLSIELVKKD